MKSIRIVGLFLVCFGLYLSFVGINKLSDTTKNIELLGMQIEATGNYGQTKTILVLLTSLSVIIYGMNLLGRRE